VVALGCALAIWPTLIVAGTAIALVLVLALRAPEYAFLVAVLLVAGEGLLKAMLTHEGTPLTVSTNAVGAALLDLCLIATLVALVRRDSVQRLEEIWRHLPRSVHVALALLSAWIVVSVAQALAAGSLEQGLQGFRLVQMYVLVGIVGALLLWRLPRTALVPLVLAGLLVISGYAVFRLATGPGSIERTYNLSRAGIETYGGVGRAAGSFSAAAGLTSYLVPAAVFAFVIALAIPRYRILATTVFGCAAVAIIASYVRVGVVALACGLLLGGILLVAQSPWTRHQKVALLGVVAGVFVVGSIGTAFASQASSDVSARARAFVHPLEDESVQLRLETWRATLDVIRDHPFGTGVGSVGRASSYDGDDAGTVIADNSYLKILREQGWLGGLMFVAAIVVFLVALTRASLDRSHPPHPIAVAALAGVFAFLVLGLAGEYVEQPGKVLAWLLLGIAILEVGRARAPEGGSLAHKMFTAPAYELARLPRASAVTGVVVMCVLVVVPVALTLARETRFEASMVATGRGTRDSHAALAASVRQLVEPRKISNGIRDAPAEHAAPVDPRILVDDAALADRVTVFPTTRGVLMTVWGTTPAEAAHLTDALAERVYNAARAGRLPIVLGSRQVSVPTGLADRTIDALPGPFPGRPDPVWAGLAGSFVVASVLCALLWVESGAMRRPRERTAGTRQTSTIIRGSG